MGLDSMPAELMLSIAELLDPRSCFQLALTSRQCFYLCASSLAAHKSLWQRYNTINPVNAGRLLWDVTREVIEHPKLAYYIEDISLPSNRQVTWDAGPALGRRVDTYPNQLPEDTVQFYVDAMKERTATGELLESRGHHPYSGLYRIVEQSIRVGSDKHIIAGLLLRSPNLRVLRFTVSRHDNGIGELGWLLKSIALAYQRPVGGLSPPFQNLKYMAVTFSHTSGYHSTKWLGIALCLPSLQGFAAFNTGGPFRRRYVVQHKRSKIKEILLRSSSLTPKALTMVLGGIDALEAFVYDVSEEGYRRYVAPRRVAAILLEYARHSLKELTLTGDEDRGDLQEIDLISFHDFQRLRILRCSWGVITGESEDQSDDRESLPEKQFSQPCRGVKPFDIASRLPRSLEALHLETKPENDVQRQGLIEMVRKSATAFPNLKQVYATTDREESVQDLVDVLKEKGLEYHGLPDYTTSACNPLAKLLEGLGEQ